MKGQAVNQLINFTWTILCFIPIIYYWFSGYGIWFYVFFAISLLFGFLPNSLLKFFQLSNSIVFYEKAGVRVIQKFVQNGTYANRTIQKHSPAYRVIKDRTQVNNYLNSIALYERYHLLCFVFFSLTFILSIFQQQYGIAALILVANVVYNVCPLLLQQYNKLKVMRLLRLTKP